MQIAAATEVVAVMIDLNEKQKYSYVSPVEYFAHLLMRVPIAMLGGLAADMIEPADNPHHRDFFHSVVCAGLTVAAMNKIDDPGLSNIAKPFMRGHLSHIAADAFTPMGVPFLTRQKVEELKPRKRASGRIKEPKYPGAIPHKH